ncbi:MAG: GNAT family N-acetyltransferase [Bacilli bacterium]|nr:GNAT family N-acetyltransferase [Bacilli bacterium]
MIKELTIDDKEKFNELGLLINKSFNKVFDLDAIINSDYDYLYGYYEDELLGFIHLNKLYENMDIVNIVVDPKYRRQGIATDLIDYSVDHFDDLESVMLEVNENNKDAINLYINNKFHIISKREKYYDNDDALIMKRDVKDERC